MIELLTGLGRWSVPTFWAPVAAWTVIAATAMAALGAARGLHPLFAYRLRQAVLLSLPVTLSAVPWAAAFVPPREVFARIPVVSAAGGPMALVPALAAPARAQDPLALWLGLAVVLVAAGAAIRMTILGRRLLEVRRFEGALIPIRDPAVLQMVGRLMARLGVDRPVAIRVGPAGCVPMTFRWRRPVVVVPEELLKELPLFELAVAHELIHVRRGDYCWGLLEWGASALFAFHPLVWMLSRSIDAYRESSCDADVIGSRIGDSKVYGQLLLTLTSRPVPVPWMAAGIMTRSSKLKQRVKTMTQFIDAPPSAGRSHRSVAAASFLMLAVALAGACVGQVSDATETDAEFSAAELTSSFGPIGDETREAALRRLGVQMTYLNERIEEARDSIGKLGRTELGVPNHMWERAQLLDQMYLQRLEIFETLKLEAETERRLREL